MHHTLFWTTAVPSQGVVKTEQPEAYLYRLSGF